MIAKAGRPLVSVIPYTAPAMSSRTGFLKGRVSIPDDFDRMGSKEISALFEGEV